MQPRLHRVQGMGESSSGSKVGVLNRVLSVGFGPQQAARSGEQPLSARVNRTKVGAIAHAEILPQQTAIRKEMSQIHGLVRLMCLMSRRSIAWRPRHSR